MSAKRAVSFEEGQALGNALPTQPTSTSSLSSRVVPKATSTSVPSLSRSPRKWSVCKLENPGKDGLPRCHLKPPSKMTKFATAARTDIISFASHTIQNCQLLRSKSKEYRLGKIQNGSSITICISPFCLWRGHASWFRRGLPQTGSPCAPCALLSPSHPFPRFPWSGSRP